MGDGKKTVRRRAFQLSVLLSALVIALFAAAFSGLARPGLYAVGLLQDGGASTIDPKVFEDSVSPASDALPAKPGVSVLGEAPPQPGSSPQLIEQKIRSAGPVTGNMMGTVVDAASGTTLYDKNAHAVGTPASTHKVLTSVAALDLMGPAQRFPTRVLVAPGVSPGGPTDAAPTSSASAGSATSAGTAGPDTLWIVGGGDPYLSRAALTDLATRTVAALPKTKQGPVQLKVDATLFAGPAWHPDWLPGYRDFASPTTALWVDQGRTGNAIGPRTGDPARGAADYFAGELRRLGVNVGSINNEMAPAGATELTRVESIPLENIVESVLEHSDNDAAETIFRHIGRTGGGSGSITDAQAAMQADLTKLGVWEERMRVVDGCGLSRSNLDSPVALVKAMQLATDNRRPDLRAVATGMSVAGAEGTLVTRYVEPGTEPGRGLVRAKTGTLTMVHSLAGFVRDSDGALLVFSFIVNGEQDEYATRVWLDKVTAALTTCGCKA